MSQYDSPHPEDARNFAVTVVRQLRDAGYQAVWAGGCVRDQLLGITPKDYDVATNAEPAEVRGVFGRRRTLEMGAAFGVVTIVGTPRSGHIEVATFRRDAEYSDGRRPDSVIYSSAEEDAARRDFTINGLFFDPLEERVIDYVDGQADLARELIRAIGEPEDRIAEDKLRMLRAVRIAAKLRFDIDPHTLQAIRERSGEIHIVSPERIGAEMRRILAAPNPALGVQWLVKTRLLDEVAPELHGTPAIPEHLLDLERALSQLGDANEGFCLCLGVSLLLAGASQQQLDDLTARWRLSNHEVKELRRLMRDVPRLMRADQLNWPELQRILAEDCGPPAPEPTHSVAGPALRAARVIVAVRGGDRGVVTAEQAIRSPREQWDPPRLVSGDDLRDLGMRPGPRFRDILEQLRDEQLLGNATTREALLAIAKELAADH
ncbi:MAG: CCA tRNA nucleotidyltransferase [Planctomycetales bacterium]|nr:CCA tRNA nucleotidyltransferase [Planctomycetales bacterium]